MHASISFPSIKTIINPTLRRLSPEKYPSDEPFSGCFFSSPRHTLAISRLTRTSHREKGTGKKYTHNTFALASFPASAGAMSVGGGRYGDACNTQRGRRDDPRFLHVYNTRIYGLQVVGNSATEHITHMYTTFSM